MIMMEPTPPTRSSDERYQLLGFRWRPTYAVLLAD